MALETDVCDVFFAHEENPASYPAVENKVGVQSEPWNLGETSPSPLDFVSLLWKYQPQCSGSASSLFEGRSQV